MRSFVDRIIKGVNEPNHVDVTEEVLVDATVDFPREGLDPQIWKRTDKGYSLQDEVRDLIYTYIDDYPGPENLIDLISRLHIVGSSATNTLSDDADIDVHIVPDFSQLGADAEELQTRVKEWSHKNPVYVGEHPVELYIQLLPEQEMIGDAVYDVGEDEWLKGPKLVQLSYNPYQVFSDVLDKVRDYATKADIEMGELGRDVIDFDIVSSAMEKIPSEYKELLKVELDSKLDEIENGIKDLLATKKEWVELRRGASRPTPEQALDDVMVAKKWNDANALFKFLDRYKYIQTITKLEELMKDDMIEPHEVSAIKQTLGMGR